VARGLTEPSFLSLSREHMPALVPWLLLSTLSGLVAAEVGCEADDTNIIFLQTGRPELLDVKQDGGAKNPEHSCSSNPSMEVHCARRRTLAEQVSLLWCPILLAAGLSLLLEAEIPEHMPALAGYRFALAFWIFAEHATLVALTVSGNFFVLSGACLSLSRKKYMPLNAPKCFMLQNPRSALSFIWRRLLRLYPVYWLFLAAEPLISRQWEPPSLLQPVQLLWALATNLFHTARADPARTFLLQGIPGRTHDMHWFLHVMVVLYVGYPLLELLVLGPAKSQRTLLAIATLCFAFKLLTVLAAVPDGSDLWHIQPVFGFKDISWYSFAPFRLPDFALGMLIPYFAGDTRPWLVTVADVTTLLCLLFAFWGPRSPFVYLATDLNLQCPLTALAIWGLGFGPRSSWLAHMLSSSWMSILGRWSYGFFVFQPLVFKMLQIGIHGAEVDPSICRLYGSSGCPSVLDWQEVLDICLACGFLTLLSWLAFRLVEEPVRVASTWIGKESPLAEFSGAVLRASTGLCRLMEVAWPPAPRDLAACPKPETLNPEA